jgi:glycerol-1-phosphatase
VLIFRSVEDAPAGVRAGKAAGFKVLGLTTSHTEEQVREAGADWIVPDLSSVQFVKWDDGTGRVHVTISNILKEKK